MKCPKTGKFGRMDLSDDGALDTVFRCSQCGREERYTYDGEGGYGEFKKWAQQDARESHEVMVS